MHTDLILLFSAIALSFSILSLVVSVFSIPHILKKFIEFKAKELSTHTVVPGQLFDMMEKNPDFMPSADDIEFPKEAEKAEKRKLRYG